MYIVYTYPWYIQLLYVYIYIYMLAPPKNLPFARFYWYLQCFQCVAQDKFDSIIWAILQHVQIWVDRRWENISRIIDNFCWVFAVFWLIPVFQNRHLRIQQWQNQHSTVTKFIFSDLHCNLQHFCCFASDMKFGISEVAETIVVNYVLHCFLNIVNVPSRKDITPFKKEYPYKI